MSESVVKDSKTLKRARTKMKELGIPLPEKGDPKAHVSWPGNVGDLSSEEIAQHMTWWTAWSGFVRYELAEVETNVAALTAELELVKGEAMHKSEGDYKTVTELKAAVAQMSSVQTAEAMVLEASATKRMLKALLVGYEEKYQTISREVSRRQGDREEANSGNSRRFQR